MLDNPKLTINPQFLARSPTKGEALKKAVEQRKLHNETFDEAWARILAMKNSDADMRRLQSVKQAMEQGTLGRDTPDKRFSKAEALRMWRVLDEQEQAKRLAEMVKHTPDNYWLITDEIDLADFLDILDDEDEIVFDVETTGVDIWSDYIVGHVISAVKADIHAYIPTKHDEGDQINNEIVLRHLRPIYEDEALGKIAHNAKFDIHMLANEGIELRGLTWDTQVAMHVLNENERFQGRSYQLKPLVTHYLRDDSATYGELFGKRGFNEIELDVALAYAAKDGDVTLRLRNFQRHHLKRVGLLEYYEQVENPVIYASIEMERAGFVIDTERADKLATEMREELDVIERGLIEHFGDINFNSPAQLSAKFYDELKLDRHLPTGYKLSTNVDTLNILAEHHEGAKLLLDYREKTKLLGTYLEALPKQIQADGRVHGTFNQMGTVTGRFSANSPNLQNQPYFARQLFVAPKGHVILSADFSQQEPRWLAHYSDEKFLIDTYRNDKDLYTEAAAELFDKTIEECGRGTIYREMMKTGILATMYGTGHRTLANQLDISEKEAKDFLEQFAKKYRKVDAWVKGNEAFARKHGYVEMYKGRKRRLPDARKRGYEQFRAMRQATNAIIQGSAAIHTKMTLLAIQELCERKGWTLAFTVHDEIGVYAPEDITVEDVKEFEKVMTETVQISVPNKSDVEIGYRWSDGIDAYEWIANKGEER